jgi:hypothetical protein
MEGAGRKRAILRSRARGLRLAVVARVQTALPDARVLRRYANRKIYDPYQSRYVNHAEIAALVRAGSRVTVLDRRTKRDVTVLALARILSLEEERPQRAREEALLGLLRAETEGPGAPAEPAVPGAGRSPGSPAERAPRVVDELLCSGQRGAFVARRLLADQRAALDGLEGRARQRGEEAAGVVEALRAVRGQLERIARRVERLDERLRDADGEGEACP